MKKQGVVSTVPTSVVTVGIQYISSSKVWLSK